jgi:chaperone required for assembly of F1-ATPase
MMAEPSEPAELLAKRFYKSASVGGDRAPFAVLLDGKPIRTPMKNTLELPARRLAEAIVAEWLAQKGKISPSSLPLTRLANTAIDRAAPYRSAAIDEIVKFAGSDLVCYRADEPSGLRQRQERAWNPVLAWARRELDVGFHATSGIMFRPQPGEALGTLRAYLEPKSPWELTAVHNLTTLTGSALLALMAAAGAISSEAAWAAAHVDEDWQIEHWGKDAEAEARRAARRHEFDLALRFLELLRA